MSQPATLAMLASPREKHTANIKPSAPEFTPSKKLRAMGEPRNFGMSGLLSITKMKEGRKTPMVATAAPGNPSKTYPIKVAVERMGPGVNWPMAMVEKVVDIFHYCGYKLRFFLNVRIG